MADGIGGMLAHPLVLQAAWMRVDSWYRGGNLAPQPELARWRLYPEGELQVLAGDLRAGKWKPSPWLQLPYPKKGAQLRHYLLPSVRDQVAFMAYMVLLGPLLDGKMESFVFGNRWFRPIAWDRRRGKPGWVLRPYPLLTSRSYQPYARAFGLYRRVAHWTVARMIGARVRPRDYVGRVRDPDDYPKEALPPWVQPSWWGEAGGGERGANAKKAHWMTLDIQLAFPSVRLKELRRGFQVLLSASDAATAWSRTTPKLTGYPDVLLQGLESQGKALAEGLVTKLNDVRFAQPQDHAIPRVAWRPYHARADLPGDDGADKGPGIPTGLAISGVLLNVALHPADRAVLDHLKNARGDKRGAFLRFADDMTLLSRSIEGLWELADVVVRAITSSDNTGGDKKSEGRREARLGHLGESPSNLYINPAKIGPEPIAHAVKHFLQSSSWEECGELQEDGSPEGSGDDVSDGGGHRQDHSCNELVPASKSEEESSSQDPARSMGQWWKEGAEGSSRDGTKAAEWRALVDLVERAAVAPDGLGPFVTSLVERLSEMGHDGLDDRFGRRAEERLARLHELARFDIDDQQVRPQTRRLFAANRLVRAWLPAGPDESRRALREIRESVAHVLRQTPWKESLWRSVVRAAAMRPQGVEGNDAAEDDQNARRWLETQLRLIQHPDTRRDNDDKDDGGSPAWLVRWPEEGFTGRPHRPDEAGEQKPHGTLAPWKVLYVSFHRAAFWRALAQVVGNLLAHIDRGAKPRVVGGAADLGPPPTWWTVRAVPEGRHRAVADFLRETDVWIEALHPGAGAALREGGSTSRGSQFVRTWPPWEQEALVLAVLAGSPRATLAEAWRQSQQPGPPGSGTPTAAPAEELLVPGALPALERQVVTREALRAMDRLAPRLDSGTHARKLGHDALVLTSLGAPDHRLTDVLFPRGARSRVRGMGRDPRRLVAVASALGCGPGIAKDVLEEALTSLMGGESREEGGLSKVLLGEMSGLTLLEYDRIRRLLLGH